MNSKFVSVIIPTYNYADRISKAIDSILLQDYASELIEIIVVDDGSSDNTKEVLSSYIKGNKIEYYYQENQGKSSATALAIKMAKGDVIFNLDADDVYLPQNIAKKIEIYNLYPHVGMVSNSARIYLQDQEHLNENVPKFLLGKVNDGIDVLNYFYSNNIFYGGGSTFSCRKSILDKYTISRDSDMYIDELLVLVALQNGDVFFTEEILSVWNVHSNNYSRQSKTLNNQIDRLINSSISILKFINTHNYAKKIQKLYELKHQIRLLSFKEDLNSKTIKDIINFLHFLIVKKHFSLPILFKYHAFNRLIPISLYRKLKKSYKA